MDENRNDDHETQHLSHISSLKKVDLGANFQIMWLLSFCFFFLFLIIKLNFIVFIVKFLLIHQSLAFQLCSFSYLQNERKSNT